MKIPKPVTRHPVFRKILLIVEYVAFRNGILLDAFHKCAMILLERSRRHSVFLAHWHSQDSIFGISTLSQWAACSAKTDASSALSMAAEGLSLGGRPREATEPRAFDIATIDGPLKLYHFALLCKNVDFPRRVARAVPVGFTSIDSNDQW
ncbi:hypothetical protein M514_12071 [Trichuris suis]|uniref:Uncharacterized protein n=1 Tax=Trichuris suis TaxID=68888 RepID=A0A085LQ37_9BILA|nr:hypothetical protein M513_12071 [Trichuris suis]KFD61362.1 hypothetical protein M514_12071 [Trichuris suis]